MSWDYLISGFLASLIMNHREKKQQQKALLEESAQAMQNMALFEEPLEDTEFVDEGTKIMDTNWREKYRDNKADIQPDWYNTEEEFLVEYEHMLTFMHTEFMKAVRTDLTELSKNKDLRLAAAIIYIRYRDLKPNYYDCAMECLAEIMERNGIDMGTVISVADQLDEAIQLYDENPDTNQEFTISLL